MDIFYSNINRLNEDIEDFVIAKSKIEKVLIYNEIIDKKMSIKEFLDYIDLKSSSYIINSNHNMFPIPFNIQKPDNNTIVVIYSTDTQYEEHIDIFKSRLEQIGFDIRNLNKISELDIINGIVNLSKDNYFIIDNNFYK